jgi:dTDP-glucose 4,6-dehydratase
MNNFAEMQSAAKYPVIVQRKVAAGETLQIHASESGEIGSRSYIHSRNFADAVLFIIKNLPPYMHIAEKADRPDRYNIAGDVQLDNLELAQTIAKLMGKELKYETVNFHNTRPGHDPHYGLTRDKLEKAGWKQPLSFEESLKNVVEWQTQNHEWIS